MIIGEEKMEYVYAALVLHEAGKPIKESSIMDILNAAGASPDETRVKALVAALDGVDIEEALSSAVMAAPAAAAAGAAPAAGKAAAAEKEEEEEEEEEEDDAEMGLGALFG